MPRIDLKVGDRDDSVPAFHCDCCNEDVDVVVEFEDDAGFDTVWLCQACLEKGTELARENDNATSG